MYPACASASARSTGEISSSGRSSRPAPARLDGGLSRGSIAAAEAITSRADPVLRAWSARARAEAISKCGDRPRYGSTSCDGSGSTRWAASASEAPSSTVKKNRASEATCSTSASVGTITSVRSRAAAAAANNAFADGVKPLTDSPGTPRPRRLAAVLSSARSVSEMDEDELMASVPAPPGTLNYRTLGRWTRFSCQLPADCFTRSMIALVEYPCSTGSRMTAPPRASTVSRPTI